MTDCTQDYDIVLVGTILHCATLCMDAAPAPSRIIPTPFKALHTNPAPLPPLGNPYLAFKNLCHIHPAPGTQIANSTPNPRPPRADCAQEGANVYTHS